MSYILFEDDRLDLDFVFSEPELRDFREMWKAEISLVNIAKKLKRRPVEIGLLIVDHAERGLIQTRASGVNGL